MPYVVENYNIPEDWDAQDKYKKLLHILEYLAEIAKIELSSDDTTKIEEDTNILDEEGEEIYIDLEISRAEFDKLIDEVLKQTIQTTRETIQKAGLTASDIDKVIFIGGPVNYKPLRDKISTAIGIAESFEVNPMTAVSEGAAIFAESIDWESELHDRKSSRAKVKLDKELGLSFRYESRTPNKKAKVGVILTEKVDGYTFEINSIDTGWTSGTILLKDKELVTVPLAKRGANKFIVTAYDDFGREIPLAESEIVIVQTLANFSQILANHSIGIEARKSRRGSKTEMLYLVRQGDQLPAKGTITVYADEEIKAGSDDSLNFKLFEGEIDAPVTDNRFVGHIKIYGYEFDFGKIVEGAEIICNYTLNDAGSLNVSIEIPSIGESFDNDINFYVAADGKLDSVRTAEKLSREGKDLIDRIRKLGESIEDGDDYEKLCKASEIVSAAITSSRTEQDKEEIQRLEQDLNDVKTTLNIIRKDNLETVQRNELDILEKSYTKFLKADCTPQEIREYEELFKQAKNFLEVEERDAFEETLAKIRYKNRDILEKDDRFIAYDFEKITQNPNEYLDREKFFTLKQAGERAIVTEDFQMLRKILDHLYYLRWASQDDNSAANIFKG